MKLSANKKFYEFVDYVYSFYGEYADDTFKLIEVKESVQRYSC